MSTTQSMMMDSYIGGIGHVSFVPPSTAGGSETVSKVTKVKTKMAFQGSDGKSWKDERVLSPSSLEPAFNQTDEDKLMTSTDEDKQLRKSTNINMTEEYNVGYTGLSILPWENFVMNPRVFNDLFYAEKTHKITYDPDEVNVFFHGKNVLPPTVGDISENGKSWNIVVQSTGELREVRACLTERSSVYGVTLLYREGKFSKPERAPCLVMLDPLKSNLGDRLYTVLTRAMDSMHVERRFCIEINLNGCVERWCRRVLLTQCEAVGAKLIITNGEEYGQVSRTRNIACCVACFPVWLLRNGIYKLHRMVVYDDFLVRFDGEDLFLHGAFQDPTCQRRKIFTSEDNEVFRIQSVDQTDEKTLENLGLHKFLCVKKYDRDGCMLNEDGDFTMQEYRTITFNRIIDKRKDRVLSKEKKVNAKTKTKDKNTENIDDIQASGRKVRFDLKQTKAKVPAIDKNDERHVHNNEAFQDSDNENDTDSFKTIPVLSSSYDVAETEKTDAVDMSQSTGSFFSNQTAHASPRLQRKASLVGPDEKNDDLDTNVTNIKSFHESDISENDEESEDEEHELDGVKSEVKSSNDLTGEMKRINQTLPNSLNKRHKAKDIEEIRTEEQQNRVDQKKFSEGKSKDKTKIKHVLKDLFKTTTGQPATLPLAEERGLVAAQRKTHKAESESKKIEAKLNTTEHVKPKDIETSKHSNNDRATNQDSISNSMKTNIKSIKEQKTSVISHERREYKQNESESNSTGTHSKNNVKSRPGKKAESKSKSFKIEESSSDGDDVEMIYQSDKEIQKRKEMYQLNTDTDDATVESGVTLLKPILKPSKRHIPKSKSPEMVRKVCKEISKPDSTARTSKEFKMPDDLVLEDNEDDVWNSLRSSQIIPVSVTDSMRSMESVLTNRSTVEKDIQILDWEADLNEGSTSNTSPNTNSNSVKSKSLGENLASQKKRRGVNRLDSSRKYLGSAVPKTRKNNK